MLLTDFSSDSMCFILSPGENLSAHKDSTMIASWHYFLNGLIFSLLWKVFDTVAERSCNFFRRDAFSCHVFVSSGEVEGSVWAIGEHGVVISCWYLVDRLIDRHSNGDPLCPLPSQGSLVVAAKWERWSIGGEYNCVKSSTGYFVYISFEKRIGNYFVSIFLLLILI